MEMPEVQAPTLKPQQTLIQDTFLEKQRQTQAPVSVYLVSGIRLQGTIAAYDPRVVLLKSDNYQLIYKRAIATIAPSHLVNSIKQQRQFAEDDWGNR